MDILEQFLYSISYKFPKGYPDITDKNDFLILENEFKRIGVDLRELETYQNHWQERVQERGTILDITNFPKDYPMSKQEVIELIQNEFKSRTNRLLNLKDFPSSVPNKVVAYKLLKPILIYDNKRIPLKLKTKYSTKGVEKINIGIAYVAIISDNILRTLLLLDDDNDDTLKSKSENNLGRGKIDKNVRISTAPNYEFIIAPKVSASEVPRNLIDPTTLPYKIRASYRPGSEFIHNDYGTGKVVAASVSGKRAGEPDYNGVVEWVEVDFNKPYLSGGVFKKTRVINRVLTTSHFNPGAGGAAE
jgi:hypothetical protein